MKIAFDAKRITHNATGLGNYGRFVVNSLASSFADNEYLLYSPKPCKKDYANQLIDSSNIKFMHPTGSIYPNYPFLWRVYYLTNRLLRDKVDIFHGLSNELPIRIERSKIPTVVTIHDLIFNRYPEYFNTIDRKIYDYKFNRACTHADKIVAVSQRTKNDIINFYGIEESKIEVVYQGCHSMFASKVSDESKSEVIGRHGITRPFILYVGSIEQRKNLMLIVKAMTHLSKDTTLVAIGKRTPYTAVVEQFVKENNLQERVKILTSVSHADLPAIYQSASVFVYPSFFEGFGIPVLEALTSGIPVIAATGSCLEEAGGPDSLYVDPFNHKQLASYISEIINNSQLANQMRIKGLEYAKKFDHSKLAMDMMKVYNGL